MSAVATAEQELLEVRMSHVTHMKESGHTFQKKKVHVSSGNCRASAIGPAFFLWQVPAVAD